MHGRGDSRPCGRVVWRFAGTGPAGVGDSCAWAGLVRRPSKRKNKGRLGISGTPFTVEIF